MSYEIRLEQISRAVPTLVVRRLARLQDLPAVIPKACGLVWNAVKAQQIKGAGRHVSLYLDGQINLEIGVELETACPGSGEVVGSQLPTGTVATTTHLGPYSQLHLAHAAIRSWCAANEHTIAGPSWEIYGHWESAWNGDPSRIRTDVFYLLRMKA